MARGQKTGGRSAGTPNKSTKQVKDIFAAVFSSLQNNKRANLLAWAKDNPTEFYKLAAKLIPLQVSGDPDHPLVVQWHEKKNYGPDDKADEGP